MTMTMGMGIATASFNRSPITLPPSRPQMMKPFLQVLEKGLHFGFIPGKF